MEFAVSTKKKYDFFISYSNADTELVEPIVRIMQSEYNATCWFQKYNSKYEYTDEIIKGIESSRIFIIFVSKNSAASHNVLRELHYATSWNDKHEEYRILPIKIDIDEFNIQAPQYKKVLFYLGPFNMLSFREMKNPHEVVRCIFEQCNYVGHANTLEESTYRTTEVEEMRLLSQIHILTDVSNHFFTPLIKPDSAILDVGCARGTNIMTRLGDTPYRYLLGIDRDPESIDAARSQYESAQNEFLELDCSSPDFTEVISAALDRRNLSRFDVIHVSALILHLQDPEALMKKLYGLLKTGGYIFIQDEDDGGNICYPYRSFFKKAFDIWLDSNESGDRFCARKIPGYLRSAGFRDIQIKKTGVSSLEVAWENRSAFWDLYFNYELWEALQDDSYFHNPTYVRKLFADYQRQYDEVYEEYMQDNVFIQLGFYFFLAQK